MTKWVIRSKQLRKGLFNDDETRKKMDAQGQRNDLKSGEAEAENVKFR